MVSIFLRHLHFLDGFEQDFNHLFNGLGVFKYGSEAVRRTVFAVSPLVKPDVCFIVGIKILVVIFKMFYKELILAQFISALNEKSRPAGLNLLNSKYDVISL